MKKNKVKVINKILLITALVLLFSCKSGDESDWFSGDFYSNDKSKLSSEIVDEILSCKFNPPINWSFQSAELSRKIESKNRFQDSGQKIFTYSPLYLFFNDSTGSLLSVGLVETTDSSATVDTKMNNYRNLLSNKYRNDKLSMGSFTKSGIKFTQLRSEKETFVNYKILFANSENKLIQIDCTIRKEDLKTELDFLKATVGSIQLIKK